MKIHEIVELYSLNLIATSLHFTVRKKGRTFSYFTFLQLLDKYTYVYAYDDTVAAYKNNKNAK